MIICSICGKEANEVVKHWQQEHKAEYIKAYPNKDDWPADWAKEGDIDE
jgi:hypothetical protein